MAKAAELGVAPEALAKSAEDDPLAATKILGGPGSTTSPVPKRGRCCRRPEWFCRQRTVASPG